MSLTSCLLINFRQSQPSATRCMNPPAPGSVQQQTQALRQKRFTHDGRFTPRLTPRMLQLFLHPHAVPCAPQPPACLVSVEKQIPM